MFFVPLSSAMESWKALLQMLDQFIAKGRADAKAWAEETGILELISKSQQPDPEEVETGGEQKSRMSPTDGHAATANT